jgi:hypothetical protein
MMSTKEQGENGGACSQKSKLAVDERGKKSDVTKRGTAEEARYDVKCGLWWWERR